ncbi:hypothetical protein ACFX4N_23850 [Priestia sp. YIM B13551]|uniref:hypothetical protein n=1 Tax=Priestia sp. YIM B13551 TaxID=3366306 RepID=UPI003671E941
MTTQTATVENQVQGQTQAGGQSRRSSNPFWYRQNSGYLLGVTSAPSNPAIGVDDIILRDVTPAQMEHNFLYNGTLRTAIGSISFQVKVSQHNAPYVQTISTEIDKEKGEYWEHINLTPQVKAQILRYVDARQSGQVPMQQPMMGMQQNPYAMQQNPYGMQQPMMGMQQNPYAMQQQMGYPQQPMMGMQQNPMFGMQQQQQPIGMQPQPQYGQPAQTFVPPTAQTLGTNTQVEVANVDEDDLPV